jgi:APA family basic amino acid/polyamine antiporter
LIFAMAAALIPIGKLDILAGLSSFAAVLAFLAVNLTLIVLRFRRPDQPRPFRVPLAIGRLPVLPVLGIAALGLLLVHFERVVYVAGLVAMVLAAAAFLVRKWRRDKGRN